MRRPYSQQYRFDRHPNNRCTIDASFGFDGRQPLEAGVVAEPIILTEHDLLRFSQHELDALEQAVFLPNVEVHQIIGEWAGPTIEIRAKRPCITTLP